MKSRWKLSGAFQKEVEKRRIRVREEGGVEIGRELRVGAATAEPLPPAGSSVCRKGFYTQS